MRRALLAALGFITSVMLAFFVLLAFVQRPAACGEPASCGDAYLFPAMYGAIFIVATGVTGLFNKESKLLKASLRAIGLPLLASLAVSAALRLHDRFSFNEAIDANGMGQFQKKRTPQ